MARNHNKKWDREDINLLVTLIRNKVPVEKICAVLGRSKRSVMYAIKNVVFQQLLDYNMEDVMNFLATTAKHLQEDIVPSKYFVPIPAYEPEDESEDDNSNASPWVSRFFAVATSILVAGGVMNFLYALDSKWIMNAC